MRDEWGGLLLILSAAVGSLSEEGQSLPQESAHLPVLGIHFGDCFYGIN
jgi:hypothetical protein